MIFDGMTSEAELECSPVGVRGRFHVEIRDKDGRLKFKETVKNAATYVGRNLMNNVMFRGTAASSSWYAGLIDNTAFSALSASDTMGSHSGWTESTAYSNANRIQWSPGASSNGVLAASLATTFNINSTTTINGIFVVDNNTKGGTTGTLWATGSFTSPQAVVNLDTITVQYENELQATA